MKITEDYCSFELSKLLKEKGFDCETDMYYSPEGKLCCWMPNNLKSVLDNKGHETWWWKCVAPTIQTACKWLRISHNIHIEPHFVKTKHSYGYMPYYVDIAKMKLEIPFDIVDVANADKYVSPSYPKACEAAIKYYLEHLI